MPIKLYLQNGQDLQTQSKKTENKVLITEVRVNKFNESQTDAPNPSD